MGAFLFPLILAGAAANLEPPTKDDQQHFIAIGETIIKTRLKDPDSAQFSFPNGFVAGTYKSHIVGSPYFNVKTAGWITCGTVNAKNGYGGYNGPAAAIIIGEGWGVNAVDFDEPTDRFQYVAEACRNLGF